jgi:hypothetical protein
MAVTRSPRKTSKSPATKASRKKTPAKAPAAVPAMGLALVEQPVRPEPKHPAVAVTRSSTEDWPPQAELVLSAIEAGQHSGPRSPGAERRQGRRASFRVRAQLRLYSDNAGEPGRAIYTRDIHARGLGFITPHRLPLGHGGLVDLPTPSGKIVSVPCTLLRCREAAPGWYEGSVYFNRDQHGLVPRSAG